MPEAVIVLGSSRGSLLSVPVPAVVAVAAVGVEVPVDEAGRAAVDERPVRV